MIFLKIRSFNNTYLKSFILLMLAVFMLFTIAGCKAEDFKEEKVEDDYNTLSEHEDTPHSKNINFNFHNPTTIPEITIAPLNEDVFYNEEKAEIKEINGLIELIKLDDSFVLDIKYATEDNFTNQVLYSSKRCFIQKNTAQKLIAANNEFKEMGYRIKVLDAYRPHSVTKLMWELVEDKSYVANPEKGSNHNRGASVDITIVNEEGNELCMPSEFDEFSIRSHIDFTDTDEEKIKNRELLGTVMVKHGFKRLSNEWWHFDDTNFKDYPLLDIPFEMFD